MDANRPVRPKSAQGALCHLGQKHEKGAKEPAGPRTNDITPRARRRKVKKSKWK
ncbi:hypothetical protein KI387_009745, partial [Taxus chinensis]